MIREEGSQARLLLQSPEAHGHVLFTEDGTMFLFMGYRVAGHPDPSKRALADFLPHRAVMVGDFVVHGNRLIYTPRISGGPPLFVGQAETREISIPEDGILDLIVNSENAVRWTVRWRRDDADSSR